MYKQHQDSVLFITLDSCRYDTFIQAHIPNLRSIGSIYKTKAPSYFTYGSHHAMFVGFTPSIAEDFAPLTNAKYGKIFRMGGSAGFSKENDYLILEGRNIIDGFKRLNYVALGSGAVGWFNPETETAQSLMEDFELFYYPGDTYSLRKQLLWIESQLSLIQDKKVFLFLNIGETHTPYYHEGASWSPEYNPCIPFAANNDAQECRKRQTACLEYVDLQLKPLLEAFKDSTIVVCGDHGDCWGEDGLWEHGFHHEKVLEVPLMFQLAQRVMNYTSNRDRSIN